MNYWDLRDLNAAREARTNPRPSRGETADLTTLRTFGGGDIVAAPE